LEASGVSTEKLRPKHFKNAHFRSVFGYKGMELQQMHSLLVSRGLIQKGTVPPRDSVKRGSLDPSFSEVYTPQHGEDIEMIRYAGKGGNI
jgi:hypothetical protein